MPSHLRIDRPGSVSYPRSPCSEAGFDFGCPGLPFTAGIATASGINSITSFTLAAVRCATSGMPLASTKRWCFEPSFRRSTGLGPVSSPPPKALTCALSITTRLQSILSAWRSSFSNNPCSSFQIPAACQSRSRRQQVIPEQPKLAGKSSHEMPVLRTYKIPSSATRLGTGGRPPAGPGLSGAGNIGSISSHSSCGNKIRDMADSFHLRIHESNTDQSLAQISCQS